MNDTISRQAAIDVLEERLQANGYSNVALVSELNRSIGYLMQLPSAQPERTGRWIPDNNFYYETRFVCSECKESECVPTIGFTLQKPLWDYCPNCGAKMEVNDAVDQC